MPKRKRNENEENHNHSSFRRYSLELHKHSKRCKREPPSMMLTPDLGPTKKVWSLLCSKDEMNQRNWRGLKKLEHITNQYRCMIVDWLMEVSASLKLHRETFHLAVDYFDRYLCISESIPLKELQLVATSALAIACKFEEIYPPKINVLADYTDGACNANDVITYEQIMLQELDWNFNPVTAIHWLAMYLQLISKTNEKHSRAAITKINTVSSQLDHDDTDDGTAANTSFSDSFLRSIDGTHNALNESTNSSSGRSNAENEGHVYVEQSLCVPKMFRDDFIQLAKVVDLLILDHHFLSYRYSELAAAVLFCSYQPSEDIEKITSIKKESIAKLISMVQIFADYSEECNICSHKAFTIEDIEPDEYHNIQRYDDNNYESLKAIVLREKQKQAELKEIEKAFKTQNQEDVLKEQNL